MLGFFPRWVLGGLSWGCLGRPGSRHHLDFSGHRSSQVGLGEGRSLKPLCAYHVSLIRGLFVLCAGLVGETLLQDPQVHPCNPGMGAAQVGAQGHTHTHTHTHPPPLGYFLGLAKVQGWGFCPENAPQPHGPSASSPPSSSSREAAEFPCLGVRYLPNAPAPPCWGHWGGLPCSEGFFPHQPAALFPGLALQHGPG